MAIRNNAAVYINGINLTCFTVMPIKWGNLLDEQLDECYLSLRHCPIKNFKPLTPVEIHFSNELYFAETSWNTQKQIKRYVVANDTGATESPVGANRWNHDLYIIEVTKILECIVVDTITFTNDFGRNYTVNASIATPETHIQGGYKESTPSDYRSPLPSGNFVFYPVIKIFPYKEPGNPGSFTHFNTYALEIKNQYDEIIGRTYYRTGTGDDEGADTGLTIYLQSGQTYTVTYKYIFSEASPGSNTRFESTAIYTFTAVDNRLPLKKWTITDVINRTLDLAEPIRLGETPRFKLNKEQAAMFDNVLAPQFSFTKQTLRECLQECGKVIHGEPRLDIKKDSNGKFYYEVLFDLYGQTEKSNIFHRKYIRNTVSQVIDSYASHLDSNAENLVNQLDKLAGVIVEPYRDGFKTVRTETMYVRITDENMIIPTQYPIYSIEKLECGYIPGNNNKPNINITPWVFESSVYNTQLSSYDSEYPYSKAFGLSYTQGQKNITALNFKPENPISAVFENYAIVNILRKATNTPGLNIDTTKYPLLAFRVTYMPFYNTRVGQTKTYYPDYPYGAALIYNQQSNVIESRYYGENLKGVIARIGNVEKSITYNLARLSDIPKAGQMYDDDYYISAVSVEYLPTYIKCTIGLSKDFNRLSQYIGISSVKRFSEISQTQAVERNLLYREYIVIGKEETPDKDSLISNNFMNAVEETFLQDYPYQPLTNISVYGGTYKQPVLSSTKVDITDKVQSSYSNATKTFTFTVTEEIDATKTVHARIRFYVDGATEENGVDVSFTGNSATYDAEEWVAVAHTSFTIASLNVYGATYEKNEYPLPLVNLPVISSAFGNSLSFAWRYEDNYSAGAISQFKTNTYTSTILDKEVTVSGYFQNNYQYPDYYGRMYYYNFYLEPAGEPIDNFGEQEEIGTRLPRGYERRANDSYFSTNLDKPVILRKDNREALQGNIQIDFVTNVQNLIIGSALAAYCPLVRGVDKSLAAKLYVFDEPLNKFINHVQGSLDVDLSILPSMDIAIASGSGKFSVTAGNFPANGKAWAIVTQQSLGKEEKVEDEEGNVFTQSEVKGGDVLIAQNMEISAGQQFTPIYFTKKRKIFKEDVWTEIR